MNLPKFHHLSRAVRGALALVLIISSAARAEPRAGHWEGEIVLPGTKLAIRVDLENAGGAWTGSIDIPVQGLRAFTLSPVTVEGASVRFAMPNIPGDPTFAGKADAAGKNIAGDFTQNGQTFPFALKRQDHRTTAAGETPGRGVPGHGPAGFWQGSLKPAPIIELRLSVEITGSADGKFTGVMVSLDQGDARIPLTANIEETGVVKMEVATVGGTFEGKLSADGSELAGEWRQGGSKLPLVFKRVAQAAKLNRPQVPGKPYPYAEEDAAVKTKVAGVTLAGTLTLPTGAGPHPAVVLITGSGPQDRDETIMGHRPFLVLADHLTRQGIAVLRCDDRGIGKSTGNFAAATHPDFVEDALAAVVWLKARREIDPRRIGLVGHSEGGIVAPLAAVKAPGDIAFIVLLAGVGVPIEELLIRQGADLARVMGLSEEKIAENAASQRELFPLLEEAADSAAAEKLVREVSAKRMAELTPEQRAAVGLTDAAVDSQTRMAATPWFRQLLAYDPRPTLRQVKCPVLAVNGEKDLQVAAKENLAAIREALAAGGNTAVKTVEFPGLNHLFQTCATGALSEYGQIEETFSPLVLRAVSDWIRGHAGL